MRSPSGARKNQSTKEKGYRKILAVSFFLLVPFSVAKLQAQEAKYSPRTELSIFTEYSNNSNRIFLGRSYNRRIAELGISYSRRIFESGLIAWRYDIELQPIAFIEDPTNIVTQVFFITVLPSQPPIPLGPFPVSDGPNQARCTSSTYAGPADTSQPGVTSQLTSVCGTRWSYAGGVSPLGQRLNFFPRHRLQPFFTVNGGFLASTHQTPSDQSSRFNFTFDFGPGLVFFRDRRHAWAVQYRIHHLSNAGTGTYNPGIDSQIIKLTYSIGR